MVASARMWYSAVRWLSPTWSVVRFEREAVGPDGEQYAWTRLTSCEIRDGRIASMCQFELDDEDAAFAYAEERLPRSPVGWRSPTAATEIERLVPIGGSRRVRFGAGGLSSREQFASTTVARCSAAPCIGREAGIAGVRRLLVDYPDIDIRATCGARTAPRVGRMALPQSSGFEATLPQRARVRRRRPAPGRCASMAMTSRAPTASSSSATTQVKARRSRRAGSAGGLHSAMNRGDLDMAFGQLTAQTSGGRTDRVRCSVIGQLPRCGQASKSWPQWSRRRGRGCRPFAGPRRMLRDPNGA